jgi:hypothetical protein
VCALAGVDALSIYLSISLSLYLCVCVCVCVCVCFVGLGLGCLSLCLAGWRSVALSAAACGVFWDVFGPGRRLRIIRHDKGALSEAPPRAG